jgi:hypothetical protein
MPSATGFRRLITFDACVAAKRVLQKPNARSRGTLELFFAESVTLRRH